MIYLIYLITNLVNGHLYVGVTKRTLEKRFQEHVRVARNRRRDGPLQRAILKHGADCFRISLLENVTDKEEAFEREKFHICEYKENGFCLYNATEGGEDGSHTAETIVLISQRTSEAMRSNQELIEKIRTANTGPNNHNWQKPLSVEHRHAISMANKGRRPSEETRKRMSDAQSGPLNHNFGISWSEDRKEKSRISHRRTLANRSPEKTAEWHSNLVAAVSTEECRAKTSARTKEAMADPEIRARQLAGLAKIRKLGSDEEIQRVLSLREAGWTIEAIASEFGVSVTPINRIIKHKR